MISRDIPRAAQEIEKENIPGTSQAIENITSGDAAMTKNNS